MMIFRPTSRLQALLARTLLLIPLCAGCGKTTAHVQGKVTYKGDPVTSGEVQFFTEKGTLSGPIGGDGSYEIRDCPPGAVRVAIVGQKLKTIPTGGGGPDGVVLTGNPAPPELVPVVPVKYASPESSGVVLTISAGQQTEDIRLNE